MREERNKSQVPFQTVELLLAAIWIFDSFIWQSRCPSCHLLEPLPGGQKATEVHTHIASAENTWGTMVELPLLLETGTGWASGEKLVTAVWWLVLCFSERLLSSKYPCWFHIEWPRLNLHLAWHAVDLGTPLGLETHFITYAFRVTSLQASISHPQCLLTQPSE